MNAYAVIDHQQLIKKVLAMSEEISPALEEFTQVMSQMARDQRVSMSEFNDAMRLRDHIIEQNARRTNKLHMFVMFGILLLIVALLYFVITFQQVLKEMSVRVAETQKHYQVAHATALKEAISTVTCQQISNQTETALTHLRADLTTLKTELADLREKSAAAIVTAASNSNAGEEPTNETTTTPTNSYYQPTAYYPYPYSSYYQQQQQ